MCCSVSSWLLKAKLGIIIPAHQQSSQLQIVSAPLDASKHAAWLKTQMDTVVRSCNTTFVVYPQVRLTDPSIAAVRTLLTDNECVCTLETDDVMVFDYIGPAPPGVYTVFKGHPASICASKRLCFERLMFTNSTQNICHYMCAVAKASAAEEAGPSSGRKRPADSHPEGAPAVKNRAAPDGAPIGMSQSL
jgi:hypothetical protein